MVAVTACGAFRADPQIDHSLLSWQPCAPPCWYSLELGKTGLGELRTTLQGLPFVDAKSIQVTESESSSTESRRVTVVNWDCLHPKQRWCGTARLSEDRLIDLLLLVYFDLTFSDVVHRFGPPGRVSFIPAMFTIIPCQIQLHWPDEMLSVSGHLLNDCPTAEPSGTAPRPNPNIRVDSVYYGAYRDPHGFSQPWPGFNEGPFIFLDLVPGGLFMWLVFLASLLVLVAIVLWKPSWPSAAVSVPLAGIATFLPTYVFQFSDVCTPTIMAYALNTFICSLVYIAISQAVRRAWRRPHQLMGS